MRILLTADPMIPVPPLGYGGIERIVDSLVRAYRSAGHSVALLAHPASTAAADACFGWPASTSNPARNALALLRATRKFRPHIVHSFSRLAYLLPLLATRQPVVMSYQRHTGGPQVTWASHLGGRSLRFTGCSEFICHMGRRAGGRWTAVPNFVELDRFTFVPAVPRDAPLVFLSRLDDVKGPDLAIAIARAAGRRLILAGNRAEAGPQREFFDREVAPHVGRNGIEWVGEVGDGEKNRLLGQAAALLVPIRWEEPFGIVFAEALACGTPVISSPFGALPEIVQPGLTGALISNVEEGAAAVGQLSAFDRKACRQSAEEHFSAARVSRDYLNLFQSMVSEAQ